MLAVKRRPALVAALIITFCCAFFISRAWPGLFVYLQPDDVMNLHTAWTVPAGKLAIANAVPFTGEYRPMGSVVYRLIYRVAGLNPRAFRVVSYLLMAANIALLYWLALLLSGSIEIAALAALIGSFHSRMFDLFTNNGTVYDILCYTFFVAACIAYVRARKRGGFVLGWRLAVFLMLTIAALNSKEMGVTLPAVLVCYELVYHGREWLRRHEFWHRSVPLLLCSVLAAGATAAKMGSEAFRGVPDYAIDLSWSRFFETAGRIYARLWYRDGEQIEVPVLLGIFAALGLIALLLRSRLLLFSYAFLLLTPLPIAFIVFRGIFTMYLPYAGWAMFAAGLLVALRDRLAAMVRLPVPAAVRIAIFLAMAMTLRGLQSDDSNRLATLARADKQGRPIQDLLSQIQRLHPELPKGSRLIFLDDPFGTDTWTPYFAVRLLYGDHDLTVQRIKMLPAPPDDIEHYDCLLSYQDGTLTHRPGHLAAKVK